MPDNHAAPVVGHWQSAPTHYGLGKTHALKDQHTTWCGRLVADMGGAPAGPRLDCKHCLRSIDAERTRQAREAQYEAQHQQWQAERAEKQRQWWAWYDAYLRTPAWRAKSRIVIRRANGVCEGCGQRPPTQVHHITYRHVGDEFLFELRAVCDQCHQRLHDDDRASESLARW